MTRSTSSTDPAEGPQPPAVKQADKKHLGAFNFAFNFYEAADYFAVRGEKRRGLIIDPGAASGLIGCDTLKDIIEHCIQPYGKHHDIVIDKNVTSPVSGISGGSDRTLGQVTLPLTTGGCPISFTGEVIGGEGSMCPALVGNPSLRKMNSTIFTNYFANGDGLLVLDSRSEDDTKLKMLRILLTDSGHYILPTDHNSTARVSNETQQEVAVFWNKVADQSRQKWNDVKPRILHIFSTSVLPTAASDAEGDRGESQHPPEVQHSAQVHDAAECQHDQLPHGDQGGDKVEKNDVSTKTVKFTDEPKGDGKEHGEAHGTASILPAREAPELGSAPHDIMHDDISKNSNKLCGFTDDSTEVSDKSDCQFHNEEDFPPYQGDLLPDGPNHARLKKKYQAMPEEFYTRSGLAMRATNAAWTAECDRSEIVTLPHEPKAHDMYRYPITGDSPQGAFELFKTESYIHIYIYTYIHIYIYTYIHIYIHTYIHIYIHTYLQIYIYTYIPIYIYTCIHIYIDR